MADARVRDAVVADAGAIASLIRALAEYERLAHAVRWDDDALADAVFGPGAVPKVLVAELDGDDGTPHVVGFALYFPTFSTFRAQAGIWLEDLFVRPEARGRGIGRALLGELRARTEGRVEWTVLDWNTPAQGFYRTLGASPMDEWTTWRWADDE